tara:strand:+ start:1476 stop:1736 length:261 start_codon:yes stop_codon:yes gene_type:complete
MRLILFISILVLIIFTSLTKNSTRNLESKIFFLKEEIATLKDERDLLLLENNYLSTPGRIISLKNKFINEIFIPIKIKNVEQIELK